jgi:hypothetical protein
MFCGCVRFSWKPKSTSENLKSPQMLGRLPVSEHEGFYRSEAPSPPGASRSLQSLVSPKRGTVMEPACQESKSFNMVN